VREIQVGHRDLFERDVLPDVELGPVRKRKHAEVFAGAFPAVVQIPELRALILRVPLTEVVAMGEDALLRSGFLFVPPGAADGGVKAELLDGVQQGRRLERVAARRGACLFTHASLIDRILNETNEQRALRLLCEPISEAQCFRKVVAGVDVQKRERHTCGREGLARQPGDDNRVFPSGKQQRGPLELRGDFAKHVDGFAFKQRQMARSSGVHEKRSMAPRPGQPEVIRDSGFGIRDSGFAVRRRSVLRGGVRPFSDRLVEFAEIDFLRRAFLAREHRLFEVWRIRRDGA
jgi:hypothetical protein